MLVVWLHYTTEKGTVQYCALMCWNYVVELSKLCKFIKLVNSKVCPINLIFICLFPFGNWCRYVCMFYINLLWYDDCSWCVVNHISWRSTVFRLLTDFVCLYNYEFWLSLWKIARSSVILLLIWLTTHHEQSSYHMW
jgi:hypothetical protein